MGQVRSLLCAQPIHLRNLKEAIMSRTVKKHTTTFQDRKKALIGFGVVTGRMNVNQAISSPENDPYDHFDDPDYVDPYVFEDDF